MAMTILDRIPREVITDSIFGYLDYKTLCQVSQTCKAFQICAYGDGNWKRLCCIHWLDEKKIRSKGSWRDNFIEWYKDLGRYIDIYPGMKIVWDRIFTTLKGKAPVVYRTLLDHHHQNGENDEHNRHEGDPIRVASEQDLNELERILSRRLPEEMRCSYRICNGQRLPSRGVSGHKFGLLGVFSVYHYTVCEVLLSVQDILRNVLAPVRPQNGTLDFTSRLIFVPGHSNHGQMGFCRRVCLEDSGEVKAGSICIQVDDSDQPGAAFVYAERFGEWLNKVATSLESPELIVENDGKILQFVKDPECQTETYHVKVSVATVLVPEFSSLTRANPRLMFAYRITMSMDKDKHPHHECTLQARHWDIVEYVSETNQRTQAVDGPGVIGEYPQISPGSEFSYASWTPLTTRQGYMEGHFTFCNPRRGGRIYDVVCPRFHLKCPEVKNFTFE